MANDLYHQLTQEGFKVFFARITLEDKLGSAYEPYIFAALNSAKVMVVLGTKTEYFKAVWVRNEWSRYLALIKQGQKKMLIPAYKDMDPYDLPDEFSHLQAQDMSKLGFMQDLIRGIKKIAMADEPKATVIKETVVTGGNNTNTAPLLKRAFMFLEDGDWNSANEYCEKVLDIDPECAEAYLGKLMAELHVRNRESLKDQDNSFDQINNYQKSIRFADEKLKNELVSYIAHINTRNENARLEKLYIVATDEMNSAKSEAEYILAAEKFEQIDKYKDSSELAKECYKKAEALRKDAILLNGKEKMTGTSIFNYEKFISNYQEAIALFESISGWKDADNEIIVCKKQIKELKEKLEAERLEKERQKEIKRQQAKAKAKLIKKIATITTPIVCVIIAFVILLNTVILPNIKYNKAVNLMEEGKYAEAISAFNALDGYKDSIKKIDECNTIIRDNNYQNAIALMESGEYEQAIAMFNTLDGYKDSKKMINECDAKLVDIKYNSAIALLEQGNYEQAIAIFSVLDGYMNSANYLLEAKYKYANTLLEQGKHLEAYYAFDELGDYSDSQVKANSLSRYYEIEMIKQAKAGDHITWGSYEQDNNLSNGQEPIEWVVLEVKDNKAFVISKYALDCQPYNTSLSDVTWETCSLRQWLNNDFLNTAFSDNEKKIILTTTVEPDKSTKYDISPGSPTNDKIFILSSKENNRYIVMLGKNINYGSAYAIARGTIHANTEEVYTWTRTPGRNLKYAYYYYYSRDTTVDFRYIGVRPAMWIDSSLVQ